MTGSLAVVGLGLLVWPVAGDVFGVFSDATVVSGSCVVPVAVSVVGCWPSNSVLVFWNTVTTFTVFAVFDVLVAASGLTGALPLVGVRPGVSGCVSRMLRSASTQHIEDSKDGEGSNSVPEDQHGIRRPTDRKSVV